MNRQNDSHCMMQDPFAVKEQYNDNVFDRFMVNYFAKQMSKQLGGELCMQTSSQIIDLSIECLFVCTCKPFPHLLVGREYEQSYDGFVDLSREIMKGRNSKQQQQAVSGVLGVLSAARRTRLKRQHNAGS